MTAVAGVDVGNATTEVVLVEGGRLLAVGRLPTRGAKGSSDSLRGAAALVRRLESRVGRTVSEARLAPLRAVDTRTLAIPADLRPTGRLRLIAAGVATPGGGGAFVGAPLWLDGPAPAVGSPAVAVVPPGVGYVRAACWLRDLQAGRAPVGAVLVAGDEGVLIANRLEDKVPVIDQVDVAAVAGCSLVAVEVRPPGQPLTLLGDPVALSVAFSLGGDEAADAATLSRVLLDYSNAVIGCAAAGRPADAPAAGSAPEPWVQVGGRRVSLREASAQARDWPVGAVRVLGGPSGETEIDDLYALDLAVAGESATARRGSVGRSLLVASLHRSAPGAGHASAMADLLGVPVRCPLTEPAAARAGALTTPGALPGAAVVDFGAGTIDVITPGAEVVAAGAGDLLTAAIAETLGIPRAAADWVKRGPCLRLDSGQRFEAEDGSRGFLGQPAPPAATGMLAVTGPAGLLPFDRRHTPAEWRAIRLRLKQAIFIANLERALDTLGDDPRQIIIVGGPAGDDELLGVLLRSLPGHVALGRGQVGATLGGPTAGHRYATALGLALAEEDEDGGA